MKELWIKKTVWRRYLIPADSIKEVKKIITYVKETEDNTGIEIIEDYYDENEKVEYDNEKTIIPIEFEIKGSK